MRVLIAGCGDVGNVLAVSLLREGHVVYGLKRDISTLPKGVKAVRADLTDVATLADLPAEIDHLVFMPTPAGRNQAAYESIFLDGWKNLWFSLKQPPVRTLLVSSTAVFGQSDGSIVTEDTVPEPAHYNGKILLRMEQLAASCTDKLVVLRISGIYGPGREGLIRLAESEGLEIQKFPPYFTNRIHRDDAAAALMHVLLLDNPQGLYLVTDDQPAPRYTVLKWMASVLGISAPRGISVKQGYGGKRVDNQRLRRSGLCLGFPDYRAGYGAILEQRKTNEHTK